MLCKLSYGQGRPSKKRIFGHVTSQGYCIVHTPAKYEKNPPYGCKAIAKENADLTESLLPYTNKRPSREAYISPHIEIKSLIILAVTLL